MRVTQRGAGFPPLATFTRLLSHWSYMSSAFTLPSLGFESLAALADAMSGGRSHVRCPDGSFLIPCPTHVDGNRPNGHVSLAANGRVLCFCQVCGHSKVDDFEAAVRARAPGKLSPVTVTVLSLADAHTTDNTSATNQETPGRPLFIQPLELKAKLASLAGIGWRAWALGQPDELLVLHARKNATTTEPKRFSYWTVQWRGGQRTWVPQGLGAGSRYPLYFARWAASRGGKSELPTILVEGEKAADAAAAHWPAHDVVAYLGANTSMDLRCLTGRFCIIIPDADQPGREAAQRIGKELAREVSGKVSVVALPPEIFKLDPGWDVADPFPDGLTPDTLLGLAVPLTTTIWPVIERIKVPSDLADHIFMVKLEKNDILWVDGPSGEVFSGKQLDTFFKPVTSPIQQNPTTYLTNRTRWEEHRLRGFTFRPDEPDQRIVTQTQPDGRQAPCYNLFMPFSVPRVAGPTDQWLRHARELLSEQDLDQLILRFASLLQQPAVRPTWMYLIQGPQGVGKNTLLHPLNFLVGAHNAVEVDCASIAMGGENGYYATKLVVIINELYDHGRSAVAEILKEIAADWLTIRQKYTAAYVIPHYVHYFGTTNKAVPLKDLAIGDRRFYVAAVLSTAPKLHERPPRYFVEQFAWMNEPRNISALAHYFSRYELRDYDIKEIPKDTVAKKAMIEHARGPEFTFTEAFTNKQFPLDRDLFFAYELKDGLLHAIGANTAYDLQELIKQHGGIRRHAKKPSGIADGIWIIRNKEQYLTLSNTIVWKECERQRMASQAAESPPQHELSEREPGSDDELP